MKAILSTNHAEIITEIWASLPQEQKMQVYHSIHDTLQELGRVNPEDGALSFKEVVRASWCLGFHYCMIAVESGGLVKAGPIKPQNN